MLFQGVQFEKYCFTEIKKNLSLTFWMKENPINPWQSWAIISGWNSSVINTIILAK